MQQESSHKSIIRSTALFASVQIINILSKVALNKVVAVLLGTSGVGVISIFNSLQQILRTTAGLGISQSAVRDISFANSQDKLSLPKTIAITNKLSLWCSLGGLIITIILSPLLSYLAFDNYVYTFPIMLFSISVFFVIFSDGKQAIIKGVRQLRILAKGTLIGTAIGVVISIPLYYLFGMNGIVPSLITLAGAMFFVTLYYERKIDAESYKINNKDVIIQGRGMIKMGVALMYLSIMSIVSEFGLRAFIIRVDGIEQVGLFQAGSTIVLSYFGVIVTALTTDYYPRISAIYNNNKLLSKELNTQIDVSLLIMGPMVVFVIAFAPLFIRLLYTEAFMPSLSYMSLAVAATMLNTASNMMAMIILAKQDTKFYVIVSTTLNLLFLGINIAGYSLWGLLGLGVTTVINALINAVLINIILKKRYGIIFSKSSLKNLTIFFLIAIICGISNIVMDNKLIVYSINGLFLSVLLLFSFHQLKQITLQSTIIGAVKSILKK